MSANTVNSLFFLPLTDRLNSAAKWSSENALQTVIPNENRLKFTKFYNCDAKFNRY